MRGRPSGRSLGGTAPYVFAQAPATSGTWRGQPALPGTARP